MHQTKLARLHAWGYNSWAGDEHDNSIITNYSLRQTHADIWKLWPSTLGSMGGCKAEIIIIYVLGGGRRWKRYNIVQQDTIHECYLVSRLMLSIRIFADLHCILARAWCLGSEIVLYGKICVNKTCDMIPHTCVVQLLAATWRTGRCWKQCQGECHSSCIFTTMMLCFTCGMM